MEKETYLGPYRLGELLGKGGMGSVYRAEHAKTGEVVAVKLIAPHVSDEPRFRRRFDAEWKTLRALRHEGIVQLLGQGEEAGQLFYVMELVEGESLQTRLRREKKIPWMNVIEISVQICAALKHAHDFGVYHRDIKPANLLITPDSRLKIVDFGIAKTFGFGEETAAGSVLGTADYMAPEQARNLGVSPRTDLYSLGSVMYALLVGRPPFRGKSVTEVIDSLQRDKPVPLEMIDPELPEDLVLLIHHLLEKESDDRPPTALAVKNRLLAMQAGLKKQATLPGIQIDTREWLEADPEQPDENINPSARTIHIPGAGPSDRTVVDGGGLATKIPGQADDDTQNELPEPKTHFQVFSEEDTGRGLFKIGENQVSDRWARNGTIALLGIALIIGVFFLVRGLQDRNATADEIYARIVQLRDQDQLGDARDDIRRFEKLYATDSRYDEVKGWRLQLDLEAQIRRLGLQKKLGVKPLKEFEQAFLDAAAMRDRDPRAASKKFAAWVTVFVDRESEKNESVQLLSELASFESRRLMQQGPTVAIDPRVQGVLDRIDQALSLPQDEQAELLQGIIDYYEDQEWAASAVRRAKQILDGTGA